MLVSTSVGAQDTAKKRPSAKKQTTKQVAHKKPTPEQIHKFNELQKKQQKTQQ